MEFEIEVLRQYERDGWIYSQVHPSLPLIIWNYTNNTQYENYWDDITLNCRALVTDEDGVVVSKGFKKFFNWSEGKTNIPQNNNSSVTVYDKLDGSYIGLFFYGGEWIINSKGSFTSDHVNWAKEIIDGKNLDDLDEGVTYCFELIVPENRIVVNYGNRRDLVFLTGFDNSTGLEISLLERPEQFSLAPLYFSKKFNPDTLKNLNTPNEEGFVIRFDNGERCKIKFEEYIKLHSLYTKSSSYDIWDCLKEGGDIKKIIDEAPDEIYDWIDRVKGEIESDYNNLSKKINAEYKEICLSLGDCSDKHFALFVKGNPYAHYLFKLRNGRCIKQQLWKDVKPQYKTFGTL